MPANGASSQITHPALHIANEIALIHNAMLRGLNAIYLQVSHVRQNQDVADLLFLTQSWSAWLLDHHNLKEGVILPGFEAVLGVPIGTLTLPPSRSRSAAPSSRSDRDLSEGGRGEDEAVDGGEKEDEQEEGEGERGVEFILHRVFAYASAARKHPQTYDTATLEGLLVALADLLVPHLTRQVQLCISMRDMCLGFLAPSSESSNDIPSRLPSPIATIARTASNVPPTSRSLSGSPPVSSSSSFTSPASAVSAATSSPARSPPTATLSLFPASSDPHQRKMAAATTTNDDRAKSESGHAGTRSIALVDMEAQGRRLAHARALLVAEDRASKLMQIYLSADARATASMDHFVVPPMIVRLRDTTTAPAPPRTTPSSHGTGGGLGTDVGMGVGGGHAGDWPRMSIPAVHAIADKLSPRHEGAWRFLPCDVWGRPRELPFSA